MSILGTSDWHLSDKSLDAYRLKTIGKVFPELIKEYQIELLLCLGDLTEVKDGHKAELVNAVVGVFHELAQLCPVVILQGNHDWLSSPTNPYFGFLSRIEGLHWIGRPTPLAALHLPSCEAALKALGPAILLPHTASAERDWAGIDFREYDWAFAHQTFAGAIGDSGIKLGGVPLSFFPKGLRIISGDVHRPQKLGQLTYVGSPFSVDFGDHFDPRVLLIDGSKVFSIPVPGPRKMLVEVESLAELKELDGRADLASGDLLKVRVQLKPSEKAAWAETSAAVRAWGEKNGYHIHLVQPVMPSKATGSMITAKGNAVKTDEQLLREYATARALDKDTLKTGVQLLGS